jgi:hypothetical protein
MKIITYIIMLPVFVPFIIVAVLYALIVLPIAALLGATERYA